MSKRRRKAFDTEYVGKVVNDEHGKMTRLVFGGPPKKLTGGLKKHLRKVARQNRQEALNQLGALGYDGRAAERILNPKAAV